MIVFIFALFKPEVCHPKRNEGIPIIYNRDVWLRRFSIHFVHWGCLKKNKIILSKAKNLFITQIEILHFVQNDKSFAFETASL